MKLFTILLVVAGILLLHNSKANALGYYSSSTTYKDESPLILNNATKITLTDDGFKSIPLPFNFKYYGNLFSSCSISANGFITFDTITGSHSSKGSSLTNVISLQWFDINPAKHVNSSISYSSERTNQFIIQYNFILAHSSGYSGSLTGQIVLHSNFTIELMYYSVVTSGSSPVGYFGLISPIKEEISFTNMYTLLQSTKWISPSALLSNVLKPDVDCSGEVLGPHKIDQCGYCTNYTYQLDCMGKCPNAPNFQETCKTEGVADNFGTYFTTVFPLNENTANPQLILYISSKDYPFTNVSVSTADNLFKTSLNLTRNSLQAISLPSSAYLSSSTMINRKTVIIQSNNEVAVVALNQKQYTTDAYLVLPNSVLGVEYYVASYSENSFITITSTSNNNQISFTSPTSYKVLDKTFTASTPFVILLHQHETIQILATGDVTGGFIKSQYPVNIISGSSCTDIGACCCDFIGEQMPPTTTLGKEYIVEVFMGRKSDVVRIIAIVPNTVVTYSDGRANSTLKIGGSFIELSITSSLGIKSKFPIMVVQYSKSGGTDGTKSDPSMLVLSSVDQFLPSFIVTSPSDKPVKFNNYITLYCQTVHTFGVILDGILTNRTKWATIPGTRFSSYKDAVSSGTHYIRHNSPIVNIGSSLYGFADSDSYAYNAGARFAKINANCTVSLAAPGDGVDNDCDGLIDEELCDGIDNDGDGLIDEDCVTDYPKYSVIIKSNLTSIDQCTNLEKMFNISISITSVDKLCSFSDPVVSSYDYVSWDNIENKTCNGILNRTYSVTDSCGNIGKTLLVKKFSPFYTHSDIPSVVNVQCSKANMAHPVNISTCSFLPQNTKHFYNDTNLDSETCSITRTWYYKDNCNITHHMADQRIQITGEGPVFVNIDQVGSISATCDISNLDSLPKPIFKMEGNCNFLTLSSYYYDNIISSSGGKTLCPSKLIRSWVVIDNCHRKFTYQQSINLQFPSNPIFPANNDQNIDIEKSLIWRSVSSVSIYYLRLWSDFELTTTFTINSKNSQVSFRPPLKPITLYRWQIFFHDSISNITSAGPVWSFRTKGYADLVVSNLKIYTPNIYTEQYLSFSYMVTNNGTGGGSVLRWYERALLTSKWIGSFSNLNYLDPGKSYTQYQKILIPRNFAGNYYFKIVIDYSDTDNNNNFAESLETISILQSPYPNLAVKTIQNSLSSFSGAETFVRYTVENIGNGATPLGKCWYDTAELYLNGRTTNIRTEYVCPTSILSPQSSYTREFSFEVPNGVFGQGSIILKTNIQSSIFENNELSDNTKNSPIQIILSPTPDLTVVDFSVQTIDIVNREHLISYDIQNIGTGAPFELFWLDSLYYRSANSSSSWTLITTTPVKPMSQFEPGIIIHKNVKFILPKDAEGILDFKVETNYERYVLESSGGYENNVFVAPHSLYVTNVYPDLHLYNLVSHIDSVGRKIIFNWEVENIGSTLKGYESIIDKVIISNMITNATRTLYVTNYIKNNLYTGRYELLLADYQEYYIQAKVYCNYRLSVFEAYDNRSNNYMDHIAHIDSGISSFSIKLFNPPKKVDLGRPLNIELVVSNIGNTTLYTDTIIDFQIASETQSRPTILYTDTLTLSGLTPDNMMKLSRTLEDIKCVPNSLNDIMLAVDNIIVDKFSFICRPVYGTFSVSNFTNIWKPKQNSLFTSFDVNNIGYSMQYTDMLSGELLLISEHDKYSIKTFSTSLKLNSLQSLHFELSSLISTRLPNGKYNIRLQVLSPLTYQTVSMAQIEIDSPVPSLTISKLSTISNSFTIGERINIEYEVSNNSTDLSTIGFYNSWIDTISISSSKYSGTDDIKLCWYVRAQPLNAKEFYAMSLECLISEIVAPFDEYYLNLRIITNSISVAEKTIGPVSVSFGSGYPDLSGTIIQVGSSIKNVTDKYFTNEPIHIKYSFANIGKRNISLSDSWYDSVYLVSSISDISNSKPLASKLISGPLDVNSTYSNTVLLSIPKNVMGDLFVVVVSDASNMIMEWNRENNILSQNISVVKTTTGSDLMPNNMTTAEFKAIFDGSPFSLMYTVHNIGSEPCEGYLCDNLFVSDIKIGENCYYDKLLPDEKLSRKLSIDPTPYLGDGNNTLTISINAFRSISEIDYSNNQQSNDLTLNSQTYEIGFSKQFSIKKILRIKVNNKERRVFKIQFESLGKDFQIYLKALSSPSPMVHDTYISMFSVDSSKAIFVESPVLGDYHILVISDEEQEQNLTISSKYSDIDIDIVYPNIIPAHGNATFMLQGFICYNCPVYLYHYVDGVVLLNTEIRPDQRIWNSERRIYLTFNLKNSTTNERFALCVWSNNFDRSSCATSTQTLLNLITNPVRGEFSYSVNNPTKILQTTPSYFMDITVKNRGDTDVFVPLFSISGDEQIESISIVHHSENIPLKHKIIMLSDRAMLFPRETRTISFKIKRNLTNGQPLVNAAIVTLTNDLEDRQGFEKLIELAVTSKLFYSNASKKYIVDKFISFYRQDEFKRELSTAMMAQPSHIYNFYTFINYITNTFFYSSNYETISLLENRQITIYAQFSSHPEHLLNKGLVGFGWRSNLDCNVVLLSDEHITISILSNLVTFKKVSSELYLSNDNTNNALKITNNKLEMKLDNNIYTITRPDFSSPWRMTLLTVLPSSYSFEFEYDTFNQLIAINEVGNTIRPICQLRYENNLLAFIQCDNLKVELAYNNQQQLALLSNTVLKQNTAFNYSSFGLLTDLRDYTENSSIRYNIAMYSPDFSVPYVQSKEICNTVGCQTLFQFVPSSLVFMKSTVSNYTLQQVMDISNETVLYEELNGEVTYGSDDANFDVNGNIYSYGSDIPVSYINPVDQNGSYSVLNRKSEIIFSVLFTNESTSFVDSSNSWTTYGVRDGLIKTISYNNITLSKMDHDDKQQLLRTKYLSPSGNVEDIVVFQYDETTGGLLSATLNGNQSIMISNSNNTHTTVSTPSGYDIVYIYYSNGLLKSMNYLNYTLTYYYNDLDVCIKITKSNATKEITIFERNENSTSLDEVLYGNGLKKLVTRNGSSILISYSNESTIVDFVEYVFNISNQQLKSIRTPLETVSLEYNEFNQVSSMKLHNNNTQHNYTYNDNGDLIKVLTTSGTQSLEKSIPNSRSAYQNFNGCEFQYTRVDLVKSINCGKGIFEIFEYDALDNLVAIETNETRTEYVRDYLHGNSIIAKIVTSKTKEPSITTYYHQPVETDSLFSAEVQGGSTFYYQSDVYGSFVGIADENGNSIQRTSYSIFGERVAQTTRTETGSSFIASNEFGFGGASGAITTTTDFVQNKHNSLRNPSTDTQITARGPSIGESVDLSFKLLKTIDGIANNKIIDDKFGSASRSVGLGVVTKTISCVSSFGGDSVLKSVVTCAKAVQKIDKCMNSDCSKGIPAKYKDAYSKGKSYLNKGIDKAKQSAQSIGTALKKYGASLASGLNNAPRMRLASSLSNTVKSGLNTLSKYGSSLPVFKKASSALAKPISSFLKQSIIGKLSIGLSLFDIYSAVKDQKYGTALYLASEMVILEMCAPCALAKLTYDLLDIGFELIYQKSIWAALKEVLTALVRSLDPNDILGPQGYDDGHWIGLDPNKDLSYTIRFENDPKQATAPAQVVYVEQYIDDTVFNLGSIRIQSFGWGNSSTSEIILNNPSVKYQTRILSSEYDIPYHVDIMGGLDILNKKLIFKFTTIDPETGSLPEDPMIGFLPVNVANTTLGEGFIKYSIRMKDNLATGSVLQAQARIVFDQNPPIDTPKHFNTIDAQAPYISIMSMESVVVGDVISLPFNLSEDGSGIQSFDVIKVASNYATEKVLSVSILDSFIYVPINLLQPSNNIIEIKILDNVGNQRLISLSETLPRIIDCNGNGSPFIQQLDQQSCRCFEGYVGDHCENLEPVRPLIIISDLSTNNTLKMVEDTKKNINIYYECSLSYNSTLLIQIYSQMEDVVCFLIDYELCCSQTCVLANITNLEYNSTLQLLNIIPLTLQTNNKHYSSSQLPYQLITTYNEIEFTSTMYIDIEPVADELYSMDIELNHLNTSFITIQEDESFTMSISFSLFDTDGSEVIDHVLLYSPTFFDSSLGQRINDSFVMITPESMSCTTTISFLRNFAGNTSLVVMARTREIRNNITGPYTVSTLVVQIIPVTDVPFFSHFNSKNVLTLEKFDLFELISIYSNDTDGSELLSIDMSCNEVPLENLIICNEQFIQGNHLVLKYHSTGTLQHLECHLLIPGNFTFNVTGKSVEMDVMTEEVVQKTISIASTIGNVVFLDSSIMLEEGQDILVLPFNLTSFVNSLHIQVTNSEYIQSNFTVTSQSSTEYFDIYANESILSLSSVKSYNLKVLLRKEFKYKAPINFKFCLNMTMKGYEQFNIQSCCSISTYKIANGITVQLNPAKLTTIEHEPSSMNIEIDLKDSDEEIQIVFSNIPKELSLNFSASSSQELLYVILQETPFHYSLGFNVSNNDIPITMSVINKLYNSGMYRFNMSILNFDRGSIEKYQYGKPFNSVIDFTSLPKANTPYCKVIESVLDTFEGDGNLTVPIFLSRIDNDGSEKLYLSLMLWHYDYSDSSIPFYFQGQELLLSNTSEALVGVDGNISLILDIPKYYGGSFELQVGCFSVEITEGRVYDRSETFNAGIVKVNIEDVANEPLFNTSTVLIEKQIGTHFNLLEEVGTIAELLDADGSESLVYNISVVPIYVSSPYLKIEPSDLTQQVDTTRPSSFIVSAKDIKYITISSFSRNDVNLIVKPGTIEKRNLDTFISPLEKVILVRFVDRTPPIVGTIYNPLLDLNENTIYASWKDFKESESILLDKVAFSIDNYGRCDLGQLQSIESSPRFFTLSSFFNISLQSSEILNIMTSNRMTLTIKLANEFNLFTTQCFPLEVNSIKFSASLDKETSIFFKVIDHNMSIKLPKQTKGSFQLGKPTQNDQNPCSDPVLNCTDISFILTETNSHTERYLFDEPIEFTMNFSSTFDFSKWYSSPDGSTYRHIPSLYHFENGIWNKTSSSCPEAKKKEILNGNQLSVNICHLTQFAIFVERENQTVDNSLIVAIVLPIVFVFLLLLCVGGLVLFFVIYCSKKKKKKSHEFELTELSSGNLMRFEE